MALNDHYLFGQSGTRDHIVNRLDIVRGDHTADQLGQYVIIEAEAAVVRWMFESYAAATHTMSTLSWELNSRGCRRGREVFDGVLPL